MGKMDRDGEIPTLTGKLKVDWIDFPLEDILEQFITLKEGILRGVFRQKATAAWFGCRAEKAQVTMLLPGQLDVFSWLEKIDSMSHSWPKSCILGKFQVADLQAKTFHLHRNSPEPDTCGSRCGPIGASCELTCIQTGRAFIRMLS